MKPFNLEQARQGKPVVTREGLEVKILIFDLNHETYKIGGVFDNRELATWTNEGEFKKGDDTLLDLFMNSEKKEGWINLYRDHMGIVLPGVVCATEADSKSKIRPGDAYITTIKVEWEE